MPNKIFEIGLPKTGTVSLGGALQILGFDCKGWTPEAYFDFVDNNAIDYDTIDRHEAFHDGPWHDYDYKQLDERYPGSKFIILERDDEPWIKSMENHFSPDINASDIDTRLLDDGWVTSRGQTIQRAIAKKHTKYREVREYFKDRPDDLLIMRITDGWEKLCQFLNKPVPQEEFPHFNETWNNGKNTGIITASDDAFFPGLRLLVESVDGVLPIVIYNLGLTNEQLRWLEGYDCQIKPSIKHFGCSFHWWQTWNKPYYIADSQYKIKLWLDSDICVIGTLYPLLDRLKTRGFAVRHPAQGQSYPRPTGKRLYDLFPVAKKLPFINAGVLGFNMMNPKDVTILDNYVGMANAIRKYTYLMKCCAHADEHLIQWAIEKAEDEEFIVDIQGWNLLASAMARKWRVEYIEPIQDYGLEYDKMQLSTQEYAKEHPGIDILHLTGYPKLWKLKAPQ